MSESESSLRSALRAKKFSLTVPRKAVFAALLDNDTMTMRELVTACGSEINRSSIYRSVAIFEELGIVQRLQIGWRYKLELTDQFHDQHHHHATCKKCGAVQALPEDVKLESQLARLAARYDFQQKSHQVEIVGLCKNCQ